MAVEPRRGCGYRRVGGLYLVSGGISAPCDRLPFPIIRCPVCGEGYSFTRGLTKVDPFKLFGLHEDCRDPEWVRLQCPMCRPEPEKVGFLMGVGERFYPTPLEFLSEGMEMGVSKRINSVPKSLELGVTWIYLVHPKAVSVPKVRENWEQLPLEPEYEYSAGVFGAFRPYKIEFLIWESEATPERIDALVKRGITPVIIPDNDPDHAPIKRKKKTLLEETDGSEPVLQAGDSEEETGMQAVPEGDIEGREAIRGD